jgi:hypothetical protein
MKQAQIEMLQNFLATLPEPLALRLAKAVELDRLAEGSDLPHDLILEGLRPVLRRALKTNRTPTAQRLFCAPFEDILVSAEHKEKLKGRIARSTVEPVWNWITRTLLPEQAAAYIAGVRQAVLAYRPQEGEACAADFRAVAAKAMGEALADPSQRNALRLALGGENAVADAGEMALLLGIAPEISELKELMPKPYPMMTDDVLWTLRAIYDRVVVSCADAAPYVAVISMSRLDRPWEALRLPLMIARQTNDTLISSTDMGVVGELLLHDLDTHGAAIRAVRQPQFDPDNLVEHLTAFALLSNGLVKEVEMRRDGRWGRHLMSERAAVAEIMENMMKRAPREVLGALPTLKTGSYSGGPRAPDLSRAPDQEKLDRAMHYARLMAGCKPIAGAAAFGAAQAQADDEIVTALQRYCEDLVRELRTATGDRLAHAEGYFTLGVELTSILFSAEEAEFLRRRGRAATSAQAAA